jgi:hypothetical protein
VLLENEPDEPLEEEPATPVKPAAPKETRRAIPPPPPAPPPTFPNVDLGLDYAIRSQGDLGISHTITLRLLY